MAWNGDYRNAPDVAAGLSFEGQLSPPREMFKNILVSEIRLAGDSQYRVLWREGTHYHVSLANLDGEILTSTKLPEIPHEVRDYASNGRGYLFIGVNRHLPQEGTEDVVGTFVPDIIPNATATNFLISAGVNSQSSPAVAFNGKTALVAWKDHRIQHATETSLYATRLDPQGKVLDPQGIQLIPQGAFIGLDVASNGQGFLAAWSTSSGGVGAARLSEQGAILGEPILIDKERPVDGYYPVAVTSNGNDYLAVWQSARGRRVKAARISASGQLLDAEGIKLSPAASWPMNPVVASDGKDYLAVWNDEGIRGVRLTGDGRILDSKEQLISGEKSTSLPAVVFNGSNYLVVWQDNRNDGRGFLSSGRVSDTDIYGAWVSRSGSVSPANGMPVCVAMQRQRSPRAAANGTDFLAGEVLVVWEDFRGFATSDIDIYAGRVAPGAGALDGEGFLISGGPFNQMLPVLAYTGGGRFLMASQSLRFGGNRAVGHLVSLFQNLLLRPGQVILTWPVDPGKTYRAQFKNDLGAPDWTDLSGDLRSNGGSTVSAKDESIANSSQRFYRLVEKP